MKPNVIHLARFGAFVSLTVAALAATVNAQQPFDSSAWNIHAAEWRVETYRVPMKHSLTAASGAGRTPGNRRPGNAGSLSRRRCYAAR